MMKYTLIALALVLLFSCKNKNDQTGEPVGQLPIEKTVAQAPVAAPPLPANMSVPDLRNEVRKVLRMQLPNTFPETRNGRAVTKSYSFDIEPYEPTGRPIWIIQEKLFDPESKDLITGGKYFCLWDNIDPQKIGYKFSEGGQKIALVIPAAERQSFIFHPYAQELSDEVVTEVVIGWYDRVQDATLARGLVAMQTLAANMNKWKENEK